MDKIKLAYMVLKIKISKMVCVIIKTFDILYLKVGHYVLKNKKQRLECVTNNDFGNIHSIMCNQCSDPHYEVLNQSKVKHFFLVYLPHVPAMNICLKHLFCLFFVLYNN